MRPRNQKSIFSAAALAAALFLTACQPSSGNGIRAHMEVLAADAMQGREAGSAGYQHAADYVAAQFAEFGLQPLGDRDTYFQSVDFLETRLEPNSVSMTLHHNDGDTMLEPDVDFVQFAGYGRKEDSVTAPLVFAGHGIRAPEYGHDDYEDVDIAGKIAVILSGAPPGFGNSERAYYSSSLTKLPLAIELGAVGVVTIRTPIDQELLTWPRMLAASGRSGMRWLGQDGTPQDGYVQLTAAAVLNNSGAEALFQITGRDLAAIFERHAGGDRGSFDLGVSATMTRKSSQQRLSSPNVIGMLPGSDEALVNEYVIVTAHLDHLGVTQAEDGDSVFNGAYDNAAGVATMLEVLAALASKAPRRPIIFAAVTAEEKGLRGSDYLAHNAPVPIGNIVANINIDMPYLGHPIASVEGYGAEHSTLYGVLTRAAETAGVEVTPDTRPELVRLVRSDQFSFVRQGIPGLNLKAGSGSTDASIDGVALRTEYLTDHYHLPSDDLDLPFSEVGANRFASVATALVLAVANDDEPPRWRDGDFFGERYGRSN